ncbi:hypothetical protein CcCBS67573_g09882 [Chytriomyces confervae]|uniref:Uncharacterized protein n=1 Tax=Chytriomyces confervae TaxID=246404 RepID=A0A507DNC4_9FUNG|nr:hypothetical protein CcCBS67573_g09882 [Chytriomyces confervae]
MSVNHYTRFVQQMGKLSAQTPLTKPPNNLNAHLLVSSPFPDPEARRAARQISDFEVRRKSALFNATARTPEQAQLMLKVLENRLKDLLPASEQKSFTSVAGTTKESKTLTDIPIPMVLRRHVSNPSSIYAQQTALAKVAGFRIEVNGKRGTRAARQVMHYGRLSTNDSYNSMVDFGRASFFNKKGSTGVRVIDALPVEVIQNIVLHAEIDSNLVLFERVCRKFAQALDTLFALAHIRQRFNLPNDGMKRYAHLFQTRFNAELDPNDRLRLSTDAKRLDKVADYFRDQLRLPLAYKAALFVLSSQAMTFRLYQFSADTTLRIVQSLGFSATLVHWGYALRYFVQYNKMSALNYVISNRTFGSSNTPLLFAFASACYEGRSDIVSLLMTCPSGEGKPLSLDEPLKWAVQRHRTDSIKTILNDPLQRVTRAGKDAALQMSAAKDWRDVAALLVEHGVSSEALNRALHRAAMHQSNRTVACLLNYPGVFLDAETDTCLEKCVIYNRSTMIVDILLKDERVSIPSNDYAAVRKALQMERIDHLAILRLRNGRMIWRWRGL